MGVAEWRRGVPPSLVYLVIQVSVVIANPGTGVRQVLRSRPLHVWALGSVGVVVLLGFIEFDPGLIVYLADPELLAGVILTMAYQVRRSLQGVCQLVEAVGHRSYLRWRHAQTCTRVGLRLYATSVHQRVATSG